MVSKPLATPKLIFLLQDADEEMRKQAELMEAKMKAGGMKKKTPLIKKEVNLQNSCLI